MWTFKPLPAAWIGNWTGQLDRMEAKGDGYHRKVRDGFLKLARERNGFKVVDSAGDVETVHKSVIEEVGQFF
jgi:thymidylate kinase